MKMKATLAKMEEPVMKCINSVNVPMDTKEKNVKFLNSIAQLWMQLLSKHVGVREIKPKSVVVNQLELVTQSTTNVNVNLVTSENNVKTINLIVIWKKEDVGDQNKENAWNQENVNALMANKCEC